MMDQDITDLAQELAELPAGGSSPPVPMAGLSSSALFNISVAVQIVIAKRRMALSEVMSLGAGSVVKFDQKLSSPVSLQVNGKTIAKGILVVVDDKTGQLGLSLTEIIPIPLETEV